MCVKRYRFISVGTDRRTQRLRSHTATEPKICIAGGFGYRIDVSRYHCRCIQYPLFSNLYYVTCSINGNNVPLEQRQEPLSWQCWWRQYEAPLLMIYFAMEDGWKKSQSKALRLSEASVSVRGAVSKRQCNNSPTKGQQTTASNSYKI